MKEIKFKKTIIIKISKKRKKMNAKDEFRMQLC